MNDLIRDPEAFLTDLLRRTADIGTAYGIPIALVVALLGVATVIARRRMWIWRHVRLARDARLITVHAPPETDLAGAQQLWAALIGLLRPAWRRLLAGQPHLAFEYIWDAHAVQIQVWAPGLIPPGLIERAIEAAWPGAKPAPPPRFRPFLPTEPPWADGSASPALTTCRCGLIMTMIRSAL